MVTWNVIVGKTNCTLSTCTSILFSEWGTSNSTTIGNMRRQWSIMMYNIWCYSIALFSHSVVCLTTRPQFIPKRILHRLRFSASFFSLQYPFHSLNSSGSCSRLLPRLPFTSILPSITCFIRQFLSTIWPIQLAFLFFVSRTVLFSLHF